MKSLAERCRGSGSSLHCKGDFVVDDNIIAQFTDGAELLSAVHVGPSSWAVLARLTIRLPNGAVQDYFVKSVSGNNAQTIVQGEFHAMTELYKWVPDMVPRPHSWGRYSTGDPDAYFFISEYVDIRDGKPTTKEKRLKQAQQHLQRTTQKN